MRRPSRLVGYQSTCNIGMRGGKGETSMFTEHTLRNALMAELHARPCGSAQAAIDQVRHPKATNLGFALTLVTEGVGLRSYVVICPTGLRPR